MTQQNNQDIALDNNKEEKDKDSVQSSRPKDTNNPQQADQKNQESESQAEPQKTDTQENETASQEAEIEKEPTPEERIESLTQEVGSLKDKLLRQMAEFDNYKKQKDREIGNIRKFASEGLIVELLPVIDDVERVLQNADKFLQDTPEAQAYVDGVKLVHQNLLKVLESKGVERIEALGQQFDVEFHEALSQIEKDGANPDEVVEEYVPGYKMNDRVIRHAKVVVAK